MAKQTGLILTGGGARGAYQVGVLKRVSELFLFKSKPLPFRILMGASAGAINVTYLAVTPGSFSKSMKRLVELWSTIKVNDVFRTDLRSLSAITASWVRNLSLGGLMGTGGINALLDTSPLRHLISSTVDFTNIRKQIKEGVIDAVGVTACSYASGWEVTFLEAKKGYKPWQRANRLGVLTELTHQHVLASAAIPIFFPPVEVSGNYYGDGCLRMTSPLSNAIVLGADKIFAVGIQYHPHLHSVPMPTLPHLPSVAQIVGIVLNALFFDTLLTDYDHLMKVNRFLEAHPPLKTTETSLRIIKPLMVLPSEDLGMVARSFSKRIPLQLRYLLRGLGRQADEGMDLVSYLLFDRKYHEALIDIGYADAGNRIDEIQSFFDEA